MKKAILFLFLFAALTGIHAQKKADNKWRITELDSLGIAQDMFDDQNFIMAIPYITTIQAGHPDEPFLKYLAGICCLFEESHQQKALEFLKVVYEDNKKAEDIEFYLALGYHYNRDFVQAQVMVEKFLAHKYLNNAQRRAGEKLKDLCLHGEMMPIPSDEGKLEDYLVPAEVVMKDGE